MDMLDVFYFVVLFLAGSAIGSFLNVCIDRLPEGKSIIKPPSSCDSCGKRLSALDLIPVFSYLFLGGRCRYCKARIPLRVFFVELGTGLLFAYIYLQFGIGAELAILALYCSILIVIGVIDLNTQLILNKLTYPTAVIALVLALLPLKMGVVPALGNALIGGGIGLGLFLLIFIASRGGMGIGDIKMAGLMGLMVGAPLVLVSILLAVICGGVVAVILLAAKHKERKQALPFGPFLSLAAIVTLLHGQDIYDWYISLF